MNTRTTINTLTTRSAVEHAHVTPTFAIQPSSVCSLLDANAYSIPQLNWMLKKKSIIFKHYLDFSLCSPHKLFAIGFTPKHKTDSPTALPSNTPMNYAETRIFTRSGLRQQKKCIWSGWE